MMSRFTIITLAQRYGRTREGKLMPLIGTGGTVIGARRFLKEKNPNIKVVLGYWLCVSWRNKCSDDILC